jgi:hypothetical protein
MKTLRFAIAACLFLVTVAVAIRQNWVAADLVWASWISSVVVGVGLVILSLASFSLIPQAHLRWGCAAILLPFVFPMWGVCQWGLARVLHGLFPLAEARFDLIAALRTTLISYWPFVLLSVLAEFNGLRAYWNFAGKMGRRGSYPILILGLPVSTGRMFLLVFLLACLNWAGLKGYSLLPALTFYFFPWDAVPWIALLGRHQGRQPSGDPDHLVIRYGGGRISVVGLPVLLAGLFVFSLIFWSENLRREWHWVYVSVVFLGLLLALAGAALVFGRFGTIIDRRQRTFTEWFGLGNLRRCKTHTIPADASVRIEHEQEFSSRIYVAGKPGTLELTGRDGVARYSHLVLLKIGDREFQVAAFDDLPKAEKLTEEVAAFLAGGVVVGAVGCGAQRRNHGAAEA